MTRARDSEEVDGVEEEKTTVSAGEAISISMRTKREEEGELQHQ